MEHAKEQFENAKKEADTAFSLWLAIGKELATCVGERKQECQKRHKEAFATLQEKNKAKSNASANFSAIKAEKMEKRARKSRGKKIKEKDSKGERKCKEVIERLTGKKFVKVRPMFLFNYITEQNLELDMYNEDLKLAVEYNGEQHYEYTPYFHKTKDAYYCGRYRDDMKQRLCEKAGVSLISVSYKEADIEAYLSAQVNLLRRNKNNFGIIS